MDPNTNQPLGTNTVVQPVAAVPTQPMPSESSTPPVLGTSPITQTTQQPVQPTPSVSSPAATPEGPKGKGGKAVILVVILLLLAIGMVIYILFAKNQMNNNQKKGSDNSSTVAPQPTRTPTLTPEEILQVSSPEADLKDLETDVKGL
jgi:uncharacterized protein HemX